jgi:hypothetical protein
VNELLSALRILGAIVGIWAAVSVGATLVIVPLFRAMARTNALLSLRFRSQDWSVASLRPHSQPAGSR